MEITTPTGRSLPFARYRDMWPRDCRGWARHSTPEYTSALHRIMGSHALRGIDSKVMAGHTRTRMATRPPRPRSSYSGHTYRRLRPLDQCRCPHPRLAFSGNPRARCDGSYSLRQNETSEIEVRRHQHHVANRHVAGTCEHKEDDLTNFFGFDQATGVLGFL